MRIVLLNQFIPPSQPPTARLLGDLAAGLTAAGHEVVCIGCQRHYGSARGAKRILRDMGAHANMAWQVLRAGKCDWMICLSDPMGLVFTAYLLSFFKRCRLVHWAMDIYPDIALALGAIRPGAMAGGVRTLMRMGYRGSTEVVALDEDMAALIRGIAGREAKVLPPWPPAIQEGELRDTLDAGMPAVKAGDARRRVWLYSGNLGRAHDYETLLRAQKISEENNSPWTLHFQGGGPAVSEAKVLADQLDLKHCQWSGYVDEAQLLASLRRVDALVATQRPATQGMIWPSKLALMRHLSVPLIWVGPQKSAVSNMLRSLSFPTCAVESGDAQALADWLMHLPLATEVYPVSEVVERVNAERMEGVRWWRTLLEA